MPRLPPVTRTVREVVMGVLPSKQLGSTLCDVGAPNGLTRGAVLGEGTARPGRHGVGWSGTKKGRMAKSYSVTSAGVNPAEDRAHRMRMYFIAMSLRVACVASLFWVRGWWVLLAAAGAVLLPWFAVMVGNAVAHGG